MIQKMKKLTFLVTSKEYETFLEKLRELGVVHVEKRQGAEIDANLQAFMQKRTEYQTLLKGMRLAAATCKDTEVNQESVLFYRLILPFHHHLNQHQVFFQLHHI